MHFLPDLRESFKTDTATNMKKLTKDFTINVYISDIEKACYIYAADMCLEFRRKFGGELPGINDEIIDQVTDVYKELFPGEFGYTNTERCRTETKNLIQQPNAQQIIDQYYAQINRRYTGGW